MKFQVYGDYGYSSQQLLEEFATQEEAIRWAANYCERDTGGYNTVEVAYFAEDGEYVPVWTAEAPDHDDDFYWDDENDGQPDEAQEWADFDQDC
jgi:hypothetical protein